jgi:two-component system phosphate regulon sensor histidine kinase PhoR
VGFYELGKQLLIEVADNGIGISRDNLNRVFERFFRAEKSRTRETGGSGLGLSIVKHVLEAHGQTVSVTSAEKEGSVFSFTLDRNP